MKIALNANISSSCSNWSYLPKVPGEEDFGPYLEEDPFHQLESDMLEM